MILDETSALEHQISSQIILIRKIRKTPGEETTKVGNHVLGQSQHPSMSHDLGKIRDP